MSPEGFFSVCLRPPLLTGTRFWERAERLPRPAGGCEEAVFPFQARRRDQRTGGQILNAMA